MQRLSRLVTPLLVVLLCVLIGWWITRLMPGAPIAIPPTTGIDAGAGGSRADAVLASARLFGSRKPGVLSDNVRAIGVVADAAGRGSVIVSVDGQAAKVYRVGDTLDGRLVSAIRPQEIELEAGGVRQVFRLPPPRSSAPGLTVVGSAPPAAAPPVYPTNAAPTASPYAPEVRVQAPPPDDLQQPTSAMRPPQAYQPPGPRRVPAPGGLVPPPGLNQ